MHPGFGGKCLLLKAANIEFTHVSLPQNLKEAKAELRSQGVELIDTAAMGKALATTKDYGVEDVLFFERPYMVVFNSEANNGHEKWMVRWDCCFEQSKKGGSEVLDAFRSMYDGGAGMVEQFIPDALKTVQTLWSCAPGGADRFHSNKRDVDAEAARHASDFGRWQTNQHDLPGQRSAMYWLAPMVAHSCYPNVEWEDPDVDGRVSLRCIRPIHKGDLLGVNYMQKEFLQLPVGPRKAILKAKRFFDCMCFRCQTESEG
uniref:SET domain-containing protein n=1 Tax=Eutreptiella gymnastica TaxID=73025 RepID=A0A7S1ICQ6_9EUGL